MQLTAKEACYLIGVSRSTLYRWVREGMPKPDGKFDSAIIYQWSMKKVQYVTNETL